jgi:hypothetical protein
MLEDEVGALDDLILLPLQRLEHKFAHLRRLIH